MRALTSIAALGLFAISGTVYGQALSEHAAAAAGATIGTAAGKPIAGALGGIFNNVDATTSTAAQTGKAKAVVVPKTTTDSAATVNRGGAPGAFSPGFGVDGGSGVADAASDAAGSRSRRRSAPITASAAPVVSIAPIPEPVRELSLEEVAGVKIGTSEKDLFSALGKPESHVSIPDDDGHLRESCQYWAGGKQLGTIRLDNGQVVKVDVRPQ